MYKLIAFIILFSSSVAMTNIIDNLDDQRVEWLPFSDQVMGGISEINLLEREEDGISH